MVQYRCIEMTFRVVMTGVISLFVLFLFVLTIKQMNQIRIHSFSNPYSPKNTNLHKKLFKTQILTTSNRDRSNSNRIRNGTISPRAANSPLTSPQAAQVSPRPGVKLDRVTISQLQGPDKMHQMKGLTLSQQKIDNIIYSLSIDQQSRRQTQLRMKTDQQYLKYNGNPLPDLTLSNQTTIPLMSSRPQHKNNLIQALATLKDTNTLKQLMAKVPPAKSKAKQLLTRIRRKDEQTQFKRIKNRHVGKQNLNDTVDVTSHLRNMFVTPFEEIDQIVSMKEESFFMAKRNREPFNLFQLKHNPKSKMFHSPYEQLSKTYFSFDSMSTITSPSPLKPSFISSLSCYARITLLNSYSKSLPEEYVIDEHNFSYIDFETLTINNMFTLASGQIRPQVIEKYLSDELKGNRKKFDDDAELHEKKVKKDQEAKEEQDIIIYGHNMENTGIDAFNQNFDQTQLLYLKREHITPIEQKQTQLSKTYLKQMKETLVQQLKCIDAFIEDKKIHDEFKMRKDEICLGQLEGDVGLNRSGKDIEKKIRMSKIAKNQTEKIKINQVLATCRERKQFDLCMRDKIRKGRSKGRNEIGGEDRKGRSKSKQAKSPRNVSR